MSLSEKKLNIDELMDAWGKLYSVVIKNRYHVELLTVDEPMLIVYLYAA